MWKLNNDTSVTITTLRGSKIYTIDDVFAEPKKLERFLFNRQTAMIEPKDPFSYNGLEFLKCRHHDFVNKAAPIVWLASNLTNQAPLFYGSLKTNTEVWLKGDYNDWKNNYWFPHIDPGYNCIIYFNNDSKNGTNLYDPSLMDEEWFSSLMKDVPTGAQPWVSKKRVKLLKTLKPKYNRMVLFDGAYFPHSPAIEDERYFVDTLDTVDRKHIRSTLAFFFSPKANDNEKN
tara:strand:- start:1335 stop:2024 length:690 start_codon:yes stop_codon:yes gene_type:complete